MRIILAGLGRTGRPYLAAAKRMRSNITVIDNAVSLSSTRTTEILTADVETIPIDGDDVAAWYACLKTACDDETTALVPFSEAQVLPVSIIGEQLGIRSVGLAAALISQNKGVQRATLNEAGIPQPKYSLITGQPKITRPKYLQFPMIVKPLDQSGSLGVQAVFDDDGIANWIEQQKPRGSFLLEEYVSLPEYSAESIFIDGKVQRMGVTQKLTTGSPHYVEVAHIAPAVLQDEEKHQIWEISQNVLTAVGAQTGIMHMELRGQGDNWYVIEFAFRTPGDHILELHLKATGADFFALLLEALTYGNISESDTASSRYAMAWFPQVAPGEVVELPDLAELRLISGVTDIRIDVQIGDLVTELRSSEDRPATVILEADTLPDLYRIRDLLQDHQLIITSEDKL